MTAHYSDSSISLQAAADLKQPAPRAAERCSAGKQQIKQQSQQSSQPKSKKSRKSKRTQSEFQRLLSYALKVLAKREHSVVELRRKLDSKASALTGAPAEQVGGADSYDETDDDTPDQLSDQHISQVIDALLLDGSLSDERFAAEFVRQRINKGYGPIRIRMDLLERGVSDRLAEDELTRPSDYWQQQAAAVCQRKFGDLQGLQNPADGLDHSSDEPSGHGSSTQKGEQSSQERWNRCARFLSQRGFPADLIYRTLDGRLLD